jgi:nitroimidazol reductase NimA-like FMN-containing flavoprotein (pyridoxamine 5'-phosphate oxidase superfamily)
MTYLHLVPKLSMSEAMPSFPHYAFMAWKWTLYLRFSDCSDCQVIGLNYVNAQEKPYSLYTTPSYKVQQSGEIEALCAAASNVHTVPAL